MKGNKGKNNESDSDSDKYEEKEKKGFSKTGKFEKKIYFGKMLKKIMNLIILIMIIIIIMIMIKYLI